MMQRISERERGGVLVLTALWLPVLVVMASFVIDAANWFEHRRHLQLQADSAAFAAGSLFNGCLGNPVTANGAIDAIARQYAGDPGVIGSYNQQVGGARKGAVTVRINRKTYEVGGAGPDDTVELPPCAAQMVDVKMTEAGLPWFLGGKLVTAINARARISFQQKGSSEDALPVGVPDNNPLAAAAIFINENTNAIITTQTLTKNPGPPVTRNGESLALWSGLPVNVTLPSANVGLVVALAGKTGWTPTGGSLGAICNNVLVECYAVTLDTSGVVTSAFGIDFIHGYQPAAPPAGTAAAPVVRDVTLYNSPAANHCTDDSGPYFLLHGNCTIGVKAKIDFGTGAIDPSLPPASGGVSAQVKVKGGDWGCPNGGPNPKGCNMTYNTAGANAGYWTTNGSNGYPLMPDADGGGHVIDLTWGSTATTGTLAGVQRSYSANDDVSGSVHYVRVDDTGPFANSLAIGAPAHSLGVTVGLKPSALANENSPTAPATSLKVLGSQTQAIDCDPSKPNLRDELATGCTPHYAINTGTPCQIYQYYDFPQSADWDCTRTQTGGAVGQVFNGMMDRTQNGGPNCINPINWRDSNGDGKVTVPEDIDPGDPRLTSVFVTPFGSFGGSGNAVVPIINFATFYVTGWSKQGGGQGDPCSGVAGHPNPDPVPNKTGGFIVGHFIKYVDTLGGGGTGGGCVPDSFGTCVAVLTK